MKTKVFQLILGCLLTASASTVFAFQLQSNAFYNSETIPNQYTCHGQGVSPDLSWTGVPPGTKAFALVVEDPSTNDQNFIHWSVFNIPPNTHEIAENTHQLPRGSACGMNSAGQLNYEAPCSSNAQHPYYFDLYALNQKLKLPKGASIAQIQQAMDGHIIGVAKLMGTEQNNVAHNKLRHYWRSFTGTAYDTAPAAG